MVKQEERHDEDTQLKGEEPSTQPVCSTFTLSSVEEDRN